MEKNEFKEFCKNEFEIRGFKKQKNMFYLTTVFMDMTAFSADRRKRLLTSLISKSCGFSMENR